MDTFELDSTASAGDVLVSRCVTLQTPLNLWRALYHNRGGFSVLLSNECLEMCTIFFQNSIKHILVPYKAVRFAVPVNILIIDVNLVPTSKEPQLSL